MELRKAKFNKFTHMYSTCELQTLKSNTGIFAKTKKLG